MHHNDTTSKTQEQLNAGRKTQENSFRIIFNSHFIARVRKGCLRVACERMLETERKLHILTPLLWPSRCVFIVHLMLGSTPSGLSEGPLGLVWPSLPHLVSSPLGVCWQLPRGFSECPLCRVWPSLKHLVSTVWKSGGHCIGGFSECPLGRVWPSLPHLVSTVWKSAGNCIGGFRVPLRSGVAFPTTSGLYCLEFYWQLLWGFSECPLGRVWPSLPHLVSNPLGVC